MFRDATKSLVKQQSVTGLTLSAMNSSKLGLGIHPEFVLLHTQRHDIRHLGNSIQDVSTDQHTRNIFD
jgi:hypothetical protein